MRREQKQGRRQNERNKTGKKQAERVTDKEIDSEKAEYVVFCEKENV